MFPYVIDEKRVVNNPGADMYTYEDAVVRIRKMFMEAHPYLLANDIPSEMITPAGNIVDSKITVRAAWSQIPRIASVRGIKEAALTGLIQDNKELVGTPEQLIDVIRLNAKLNEI